MPRFDYAPSGELRLHVTEPGHGYTEKVWKDTKAHPLELQVRKVIHGLLDLALERKRHREEQRQRAIDAKDLERQQAIVHQRRTANVQLIEELERQAGTWHRARFLRHYLRAAKHALGSQSFTVDLQGQLNRVDINQARETLPEPVHRAEAGEEIVITRQGRAVARLVAAPRTPRALPSLQEFRGSLGTDGTPVAKLIREECNPR